MSRLLTSYLARGQARCAVLFAILLGACTSLSERGEVEVAIAADAAIRAKVEEVVALVEVEASDGGWSQVAMRRIEIGAATHWPISFLASSANRSSLAGTYQLSASARDAQGAVLAQSRAIRTFEPGVNRLKLGLRFEASCLFRPQPCGPGTTCHDAQCVDARQELDALGVEADSSQQPTAADGSGTRPPPDADLPCTEAGARSCAGQASLLPLLCDGTAWRVQAACAQNERCATAEGPDHGHCLAIAPECEMRPPDATFCRDEQMLACRDLVTLEPRPCDANMRCLTTPAGARCACATGFRPDAAGGCSAATDCGADRGGCDRLTECTMREGVRRCGPCPDGYSGTGEEGCKPQLVGITPEAGSLATSTDGRAFRLRVPLLVHRVSIGLRGPAQSRVEVNGRALPEPERWTSGLLALGDNPAQIAVISESGATTTYELVIERGGAQNATVSAPGASGNDMFGISLGMADGTLVTGALFEDGSASGVGGEVDDAAADSGAAYVYVRDGERWRHDAYLKADDNARGGYFGISAAISGDTIVVGATRENPFNRAGSATRTGAAYVYVRDGGRWKLQARLEPNGGRAGDMFGYHLALDGDTLVVGARADGESGAAYVYRRTGERWSQLQKLVPSRRARGDFGCFVAVAGDSIVVGAQTDDSAARSGGAVYVFERQGESWTEQQILVPDQPKEGLGFGYALALVGDRLVVGAPRLTTLFSLTRQPSGEAFVFERRSGRFAQSARLQAAVPRDSDHYGASVALTEGAIVVGAVGDASSGAGIGADPKREGLTFSGAAYVYAQEGDTWRQSAFIKPKTPQADAWFGFAAAISGNDLLISAAFDNTPTTPRSSGAAYLFR